MEVFGKEGGISNVVMEKITVFNVFQIQQKKMQNFVLKIIKKYSPSTNFTHYDNDLNIDHTIISKAVVTATRPYLNSSVEKLLFLPFLGSFGIPKILKENSPNLKKLLKNFFFNFFDPKMDMVLK